MTAAQLYGFTLAFLTVYHYSVYTYGTLLTSHSDREGQSGNVCFWHISILRSHRVGTYKNFGLERDMGMELAHHCAAVIKLAKNLAPLPSNVETWQGTPYQTP